MDDLNQDVGAVGVRQGASVKRRRASGVVSSSDSGEPLRTVVTPDGRTLAFAVWGDPDGFPVLALHGTPGCRLERWPHEELYRSIGECLVTHDRAGYGRSDRRHGRRVADEAEDVQTLADHLGFERFGVTGGSGGGPHALACGQRFIKSSDALQVLEQVVLLALGKS